jgi:hypothetical protein
VAKRIYPGRRTLAEWRALPQRQRHAMAKAAQCDLMGLFQRCPKKLCRRARTCSGDPIDCALNIRLPLAKKFRALRDTYFRIGAMPNV